MDSKQTEIKTSDLVFLIVTKIMWLVIALGVTYMLYTFGIRLFFEELGLTSNFWAVLTGVGSCALGLVANGLYDTAFD